eukprot:s1798_g16.t1
MPVKDAPRTKPFTEEQRQQIFRQVGLYTAKRVQTPNRPKGEVQDLREEVEDLRAEVRRLRRGLTELRALVVDQQQTASASGRDTVPAASYSSSPSFSASPERIPPEAQVTAAGAQSVPVTAAPSSSLPGAPSALTWLQREEICDQIGKFLARSIAGEHRGSSGREKINLPSRLWIVVRDFSGQIYSPVKVVRTWTSCKVLCKPNNHECGDSVFVGVPSEREAKRVDAWPDGTPPLVFNEGIVNLLYPVGQLFADLDNSVGSLQVIQICELENRLLVAVPQSVWNRALSRRVLNPGTLVRATLVEVQAAEGDQLDVPIEGETLKLWVGFLKRTHRNAIEILEEFNVDYFFDEVADRRALPFAQALVDVSQEHFAFFSADGGDPPQEEPGEEVEMMPNGEDAAGLDGEPMTDMELRMARMEQALVELSRELKSRSSVKIAPKRRASPKEAARPKAAPRGPTSHTAGPLDYKAMYPQLDSGVVAAALQAGVPHSHLESMQSLLHQNTRATKVKDLNQKVSPDPLSENDAVQEEEEELVPADAGLGERSPIASTLSKLTSIVEMLTDERQKKTTASKLETALDGGASGSSDVPLYGSGKKAAQARRALRSSFEESPGDISALIEKLMYEDLTSTSLAPGMPARGLSARAWVEHRSHITAHRTGAHSAWAAAGIMDSLLTGHYVKAKARCALLLLMLDQASIDRGNWTLAAELALEPGPPLATLGAHLPPAVQDGESPFSKLLDARWAEAALAHLKDQDEYVAKRRNVGRQGAKSSTAEDSAEADVKRKPRPKAKAKAQPAGPSQEA